ncbi:MAG TPA: PAS domain-containing protein [Rhodocyclaceae bacterium]
MEIAYLAAGLALLVVGFIAGRRSNSASASNPDSPETAQVPCDEVHARYEAILDASLEGIVGLDAEGKFSFANKSALRMLGYPADDLVGKSFHLVAHHTLADGSVHPVEECLVHKTLLDGKTRHAEADVFWRQNRSWFPAAYQVTRVHAGDKVFGTVMLLRNLADPHH